MALRKRPIAAGIAALFFSTWVSAVGLGEIKLNSALNEPLDAEIRLVNIGELGESELLAGLASAADFANAGVDREPIHNTLVFRLDLAASGGPLLRVTTNRPVREPFLDLLVDLQWPSGRLLREYTLLLDLPVFTRESSLERAFQAEGVRQSARSTPVAQPRLTAAVREPSQEPWPAQTPEPVASGEEYRVSSGDTLWNIASRLSGSEPVRQKMAAIHRLNPGAFINGDMNLLRSGHVLRLPDYGQMAAPEPESTPPVARTADIEIARADQVDVMAPQLSASSRPAEAAGVDLDSEPSGRLRLSAIDPNTANERDFISPSPAGDGQGDATGIGGGTEIRAELSTIQEEMARTQRENADLKDRLANLEEQLATMRRLIEISDDGLRAAQLSGAAQAEGQPPASKASAAGAPTQSNNPQIKSEKGWFDAMSDYLVYALGILVLLIAGVVFAVLKKRRDHTESQDDYFSVTPRTEPLVRVVERPAPEPAAKAASIDDIDLRDEDDIFASASVADDTRVDDSGTFAQAFKDEVLELDEPSLREPVEESPQHQRAVPAEEVDDLELDLSEFELDDFQGIESSSSSAVQKVSDPLDLDDEFDFLNDADEGDTQLELAQAYIDMGDAAGAREILQEVLESGSESHQELARSLLAKIS